MKVRQFRALTWEIIFLYFQKPEVVKNNKTASKKTPVSKSKPKEKSEAAKARDEARKKMLEERKKMMKEKAAKTKTQGEEDVILIMWRMRTHEHCLKMWLRLSI